MPLSIDTFPVVTELSSNFLFRNSNAFDYGTPNANPAISSQLPHVLSVCKQYSKESLAIYLHIYLFIYL